MIAGRALTVVAILGKLGAGWACPRSMNRLAVGMIPRAEVGLLFAGIGKGIGIVDDGLSSAAAFLVMIATLLAPPTLHWSLISRS